VTAKLRLLLLSVGSAVGQNVVDAIGPRRVGCEIIGANSLAEAAYNYRCDAVHLVPPAASTDHVSRIEQLIAAEKPDLVVPCRDDDVLALATLRESGCTTIEAVLPVGPLALVRVFNDKRTTAAFAARHRLPFAQTADTLANALALLDTHALPFVGKPRSGNASRGVVLLHTRAEIERAFAVHADLVVQPYLGRADELRGPDFSGGVPLFYSLAASKYSTEIVIGPDGEASAPFAMTCVEAGGRAIEWRRCDEPDIADVGRAYARALAGEGWRGPVNVQLRRASSGELVAFELNGRVNGGTAARTLMGFDELHEIVARFVPHRELPRLDPVRTDVVQMYLTPHAIPCNAAATLARDGAWRGD
jgi:carbamoylphosphate synthase large subunit